MTVMMYDIEIKHGVPSRNAPSEPDIKYCDGWKDFKGMGAALITVFDFATCMPRVFMDDNIVGFFELIDRRPIVVGFNNWKFDDPILQTMGVEIQEFNGAAGSFDLLAAIWIAAGLDPKSWGHHHLGFGLHDVCMANMNRGKTGTGEMAPVLFQRQRFGSLVDYGLNDIMLQAWLLALCYRQPIINPKNPAERLHVKIPFDVPSISPSL